MPEKLADPLPLDLRLDLLVDAELPESDRRELLLALDREPHNWRNLSIRFLERQVEKKTAHDWIVTAAAAPEATPRNRLRLLPSPGRAIAAALLIAAVSAVVTFYVVDHRHATDVPSNLAANETLPTQLPGETLNYPNPVHVNVPMATLRNVDQPFFPAEPNQDAAHAPFITGRRRSVVIQPDGTGNAVVIPVNTLPMKFY